MNSVDEQRVIEGLQALTGGLVVTEQDITDAHSTLQDRLQPHKPRRARVVIAVAAIAAAIVAGFTLVNTLGSHDTAPPVVTTTDTPSLLLDPRAWDLTDQEFMAGVQPTRGDLVGLWHVRTSDDSWLVFFGSNGFTTTTNGGGLLNGKEGNQGTWQLQAGTLTTRITSGFCVTPTARPEDLVSSSRVVLMPDGSLHILTRPHDLGVHKKGGLCRGAAGDRMLIDRVAPGSSRFVDSFQPQDDAWFSPSRHNELSLPGVWVSADANWLLTVDLDLSYRAFRNGDPTTTPVDEGRLALSSDGLLRATCRGGGASAQVQLTSNQPIDGLVNQLLMLRGSYVDNTCGLAIGATLDWRKVSAYWHG
jgi:hypothetical protein